MLSTTTFRDLARALTGALLMAGVSTLAEWIWELQQLPHRIGYGLMHGALVFVVLGFFLGMTVGKNRKPVAGAIGGLAAGFAAAGIFYVTAPLLRFAALFVAWFSVWIFLALLARRLEGGYENHKKMVLRAAFAGVLSGIGFYAISGLWSSHSPEGNNYWLFFGSWALAFFPGIAALLLARLDT